MPKVPGGYEPAIFISEYGGYYCEKRRRRPSRPFDEQKLIRLVRNRYQKNDMNPYSFYPALMSGGGLRDPDLFALLLEDFDVYDKKTFIHRIFVGEVYGNIFEMMNEETQYAIVKKLLKDERSVFHEHYSGGCGVVNILNFLVTYTGLILAFLAGIPILLGVISIFVPPLAPVTAPFIIATWQLAAAFGVIATLLGVGQGFIEFLRFIYLCENTPKIPNPSALNDIPPSDDVDQAAKDEIAEDYEDFDDFIGF